MFSSEAFTVTSLCVRFDFETVNILVELGNFSMTLLYMLMKIDNKVYSLAYC